VLARRLGEHRGLAVLLGAGARSSFVACDPVATSEDLVPTVDGDARGYAGLPAAPQWVGLIPYEAVRGIERVAISNDARAAPSITTPRWHRYDAVIRVDHVTGEVALEADDSAAAERLLRAASRSERDARPVTLEPIAGESPRAHAERIAAALEYIARGDIYQVNLARRLRYTLEGTPLDLFARLACQAPSPYGFFLEVGDDRVVAGTSPELALEARGDVLRTGPIKGTRPRGRCAATDAAERADLEASDKERAELVMAVDVHRNDLGRVAAIGSVRALEPRTLVSRTVFSRVREVVARREVGSDLSRTVSAVLPCGSVTGAPKVRAMEIIRELEAHRRGLYTGVVGYVGRDGGVVLAMAIRTAVVSRRAAELEYFSGGGIVAGSDPAREVAETEWKAAHLASGARPKV